MTNDDSELYERLREAAEAPIPTPDAWAFAVGLGVGKTEEALRQIVNVVGAGLRVAYIAATHHLLAGIKARFEALDRGIKVAIWYGEAAEVPADATTGRAAAFACPRHLERAQLRLDGGDGSTLCGGPTRGYCSFHRKGAGETRCHYRAQRQEVAKAEVVLFAGGAILGDAPPEWACNKLPPKFPVLDPTTGEPIADWYVSRRAVTEEDKPPAFDLTVIDEPIWLSLVRGLEEPLTEISDRDLAWLKELIAAKSLPPDPAAPRRRARWAASRPPPTAQQEAWAAALKAELANVVIPPRWGPEEPHPTAEELEEYERRERAYILQTFGEALLKSAKKGFVSYGAIAKALKAARKGWGFTASDAGLAEMLRRLAFTLLIRPPVDPREDQIQVLKSDKFADTVRFNRLMMALRRAAEAIKAALRRETGAPPERQTGFLRLFESNTGARTLVVRWIEPVHRSWRVATIIVLDACHHQTIASRFLAEIQAEPPIDPGPAAGSCHVRQIWDKSFSYTYLKKQREDGGEKLLRDLAMWSEVGLALTRKSDTPPTGLLVVPKFLEEKLADWWANSPLKQTPEGMALAHFNALRGVDTWKEVGWLGIVGRPLPPAENVRELAAIIDGQPSVGREDYVRCEAEWLNANNPENSWTKEDAGLEREDPLEQELLEMIVGDELTQAVGRARLVRRPGAGVAVDILTSHPIPGLEVHELAKLEDIMAGLDAAALAAARGIVVKLGSKGSWEVIAAVAGGTPRAHQGAAERQAADERGGVETPDDKYGSTPTRPYRDPLKGNVGDEPDLIAPPDGALALGVGCPKPDGEYSDDAGTEPSSFVARLLSLGIWTSWRLRLPERRYTISMQVRANTQANAETLIRRFFHEGTLEPVDVPKRPRGRPPRHEVNS